MADTNSVRVFAPATVANVSVGFDILGFAIDGPGDEVIAYRKSTPGLTITTITGTGDKQLPLEVEKNTAGFGALQLLHHLNREQEGIAMEIHKKMPFGSGLGSSAASAAAGVFAVNELLGSPLSKQALLPFAVAGEQIADGAYHADNVGPSLLGGILFIRDNETLDVHPLPVPDSLYASVVYPHVEILTKDARAVLDPNLSLQQMIRQTGNLGAFVTALFNNNLALLGRALEDVVVEPQRAQLIPGFHKVKAAALSKGALGAGISGAGPSMYALCDNLAQARSITTSMQQVFEQHGIPSNGYASAINTQGAVRL